MITLNAVIDPNHEAQYKPFSAAALETKFHTFHRYCSTFLTNIDPPETWNCHISAFALKEILLRVHKREAYYHYFHQNPDGTGVVINQRKIGGLFAYWILKLRPLSVDFDHEGNNQDWLVPIEEHEKASTLNESLAAHTLYTYISRWYELEEGSPISLTGAAASGFHKAVLYAFRFRNISIDAMMLLCESIVRDSFNRERVQFI